MNEVCLPAPQKTRRALFLTWICEAMIVLLLLLILSKKLIDISTSTLGKCAPRISTDLSLYFQS